jgi:hypothetical protein
VGLNGPSVILQSENYLCCETHESCARLLHHCHLDSNVPVSPFKPAICACLCTPVPLNGSACDERLGDRMLDVDESPPEVVSIM